MNDIDAYKVKCSYGGIEIYISLRSIKNNDNVCSHCPLRDKCEYRNKPDRLHFYEDLRRLNMPKLPIEVIV